VAVRVETFHTPGQLRLELRVPAGTITLETVDGEETRVEIESPEGDVEVERATRVHHHDGRLTISMEEERRFLFIKTIPPVDVRVTCPPGVDITAQLVSASLDTRGANVSEIDVKTVSGDIRLERVDRDAQLKTVSGDIDVDEVGGEVNHQSVSGDFELRRAGGELVFRTVSGDVEIEEAAAGVTGNTVSGDLTIGSVAEGKVQLKSVSGDMKIGIRPGSALWVDAKSVSGDTESELPLGDAPPDANAPMVELRATAMSGDIRVVRAA
jgi:DUF4097 and DUF4098 domain-containing protein YvlB